jgi:unsaturated rhamnogalacturonyl hydrolase
MYNKACIILFLIFTLSCNKNTKNNPQSKLYSKWIIESRMGDFSNKKKNSSFKTDTTERNVEWDYVPGLVAKAILMTFEYYKDQEWSQNLFEAIEDYADNTTINVGESNIDDINAGKIFFELHREAVNRNLPEKAEIYRQKAKFCFDQIINSQIRIQPPLAGVNGFWHKKKYVNQMWLDGLFMGAAFYAEYLGNFGNTLEDEKRAAHWDDIALQFDIIFNKTWDPEKKLNYHAWSAEPLNSASEFWANPETGRSSEFWSRGMGWFFASLVDVLEFFPADHHARPQIVEYANMVAEGLKQRQDSLSGCWYQLLQYDDSKSSSCGNNNYLESSGSALFTYAYLKGIRLGILDRENYLPTATAAYNGFVINFIKEETDGKIKIIQSCESAGLSSDRKGDADYYLCGEDAIINNNTEGKVLGPFIMAALEYEKLTNSNLP